MVPIATNTIVFPAGQRVRYQPVVVVSTDGLPEEDWLQYRRQGIGGSDVAACMGLSPFVTMRDLWRDKMGMPPAVPDNRNQLAKEIGHRLESLVAEEFARKTGMMVYKIKKMFAHPQYPFMLADTDYYCENAQGQTFILEIKTSHSRNRYKWANNTVPFHVDRQGRHYMAVNDIDGCFFACLFDNSEADLEIRYINREFSIEAEMIEDEKYFWYEFVQAGVEPPLLEEPDMVLESIHRFYGAADAKLPKIRFDEQVCRVLIQIMELRRQKAELDAASRAVDKEIKRLYAPIVDKLGKATEGFVTYGPQKMVLSYKPKYTTSITKENMERMRINHPDIFTLYATTTESRSFKVQDKESA